MASVFAVYGERSHSCTFHTQCSHYGQLRPKTNAIFHLYVPSLFSVNQSAFSGAVGHNDVCQLISCLHAALMLGLHCSCLDVRTTLFLQTTVLVQPEVFFLSQTARKMGQPLFSFIYKHIFERCNFKQYPSFSSCLEIWMRNRCSPFLTLKRPQCNLVFSVPRPSSNICCLLLDHRFLPLQSNMGLILKKKKKVASSKLKVVSRKPRNLCNNLLLMQDLPEFVSVLSSRCKYHVISIQYKKS